MFKYYLKTCSNIQQKHLKTDLVVKAFWNNIIISTHYCNIILWILFAFFRIFLLKLLKHCHDVHFYFIFITTYEIKEHLLTNSHFGAEINSK